MTTRAPEQQTIAIAEDQAGRFTATWTEWNQQKHACCPGGHITRQDALTCAEHRIRARA